jgi:hypothetical protein
MLLGDPKPTDEVSVGFTITTLRGYLMRFLARPLALIAVCGLALACTACNSNSKKIVGKWKITQVGDQQAKSGEDDQIVFFIEFKADGTGGSGLEVNDPELKKQLEGFQNNAPTFKYKVSGDTVELFEHSDSNGKGGKGPLPKKDRMKAKMNFEGDTLTLTPEDENEKPVKMIRMK